MATGQKTGGRTKGTPNKTTAEIRERYQILITSNLDLLDDDLKSLEPMQRIKAVIDLSKFVLPTLKAIDLDLGEQVIKDFNIKDIYKPTDFYEVSEKR
jgi:hypothetical protein